MTHQVRSSHISVAGGHAHCMLECLQSRFDAIKTGTTATSSDTKYFLQSTAFFPVVFNGNQAFLALLIHVVASHFGYSVWLTFLEERSELLKLKKIKLKAAFISYCLIRRI